MAEVVLHHSPRSRSGRTKMMLDLLGVDYELVVLDITDGRHRTPDYLKLNPFGRVPTLIFNGQVILDSAAQVMFLADMHPQAGLSPPLGSPLRAPFTELFVLSGAELEERAVRAWRSPDDSDAQEDLQMILRLFDQRLLGPYFLGQAFSALDVFMHWSLRFFSQESIVGFPRIAAYIERMNAKLDWTGY